MLMDGKTARLRGAHLRREVILSTVSGVASTKKEMVSYFDRKTCIDVITTKSFQLVPNPGNREPVICCVAPGDFGNSVGLRNPGLDVALEDIRKLREHGLEKILNISVSASSPEDFIALVKAFDPYADSIELNFSCPHAAAGYGASIGCDQAVASEYVRRIREAYPGQESALFVKLTPNVEDIGSIARACIQAGADGIIAINTVGPKLYTEAHSGKPILNNKLGGKGGASGTWVRETALKAVKAIRKSIGDEAIIIGMGGVSRPEDVAAMVEAGADAVGLGSVFGTVAQRDWPHYLEAGEFAFLFVPGLGEKPFSVAHSKPLTFLIRRRGFFTSALFDLKEGDTIYTRGLYGAPLKMEKHSKALLVAGGSGVAVLPLVCDQLAGGDCHIDVLVGTSASSTVGCDGKALFEDYFRSHAHSYEVIADDGKVGRVLDHLDAHVAGKEDLVAYLVGPEVFMAIAARRLIALGVPAECILMSLERSTLCGIGMCGECVCGDRLTCQWGTFQSYEYIHREAPELLGEER